MPRQPISQVEVEFSHRGNKKAGSDLKGALLAGKSVLPRFLRETIRVSDEKGNIITEDVIINVISIEKRTANAVLFAVCFLLILIGQIVGKTCARRETRGELISRRWQQVRTGSGFIGLQLEPIQQVLSSHRPD